MWDPIEGRIDFAFFTFAFVLFLWVAIDPRRALQVVLLRPKPLTLGESYLVRILLNSVGLALVLMWHIWHLVRTHLGPE